MQTCVGEFKIIHGILMVLPCNIEGMVGIIEIFIEKFNRLRM